jgi:hypothetical protein
MKVGKAQNLVIASRERETVPGCHTDNTSGANLIALLPKSDGPLGRSSGSRLRAPSFSHQLLESSGTPAST